MNVYEQMLENKLRVIEEVKSFEEFKKLLRGIKHPQFLSISAYGEA